VRSCRRVGKCKIIVKGKRDVTMQHIIDGNYCEILTSCRKRWPMELTTAFTRGLEPCVTMTVVPATTHPISSTILYFSKIEFFMCVGIPQAAVRLREATGRKCLPIVMDVRQVSMCNVVIKCL